MESVVLAWHPLASVARKPRLTLEPFPEVGVPEITPVLVLSKRPAGRMPEVSAQV
jgi:hypothetical protein